MVGSTVDRYDCPAKFGLETIIEGATVPARFENLTTPSTFASSPIDEYFTTPEDLPEPEAVVQCKVKVAAAVTFVGGALQVSVVCCRCNKKCSDAFKTSCNRSPSQLFLALTRLGFVTIYLSEAMTRGFTTGCAIHVFSSQVKSVFGISIPSYYGPWKLIYVSDPRDLSSAELSTLRRKLTNVVYHEQIRILHCIFLAVQ